VASRQADGAANEGSATETSQRDASSSLVWLLAAGTLAAGLAMLVVTLRNRAANETPWLP
jgi:hypothetical protein